jgi:hypothetical protein
MAAPANDKNDPVIPTLSVTLRREEEPKLTTLPAMRTISTCKRKEGKETDDEDDIVKLDSAIKPGMVVVVAADVVVIDGLLKERNETPEILPAQKNEVFGAMVAIGGSHIVDAAASVTAALCSVDSGALGNAQRSGSEGCCVKASLVSAAM